MQGNPNTYLYKYGISVSTVQYIYRIPVWVLAGRENQLPSMKSLSSGVGTADPPTWLGEHNMNIPY
jgi:hypothetical protein